MRQHYALGCVLVILAATCWGFIGLFGTKLNQAGFSGLEVASLRVTTASVFLLAISPLFLKSLRQFQLKQLPMLTLQSVFGVMMMTVFFFLAVQQIGVALAVALLYTAPIWSLLLARLLLNEQLTTLGIALTFLTVVGVALCLNSQDAINSMGIVYGLASGFCYACYGVLGKKAINSNPPVLVLYSSVLISGIIMSTTPIFHQAIDHLNQNFSWNLIAVILGIALISTLLPYALYTKALTWMPATRAQTLTIFEPVTAVLLAALLLKEPLVTIQFVGIGLILVSSVLNALQKPAPNIKPSISQA